MEKTKKLACSNCGFIKPAKLQDLEKKTYCNLCDEEFLQKDAKEHKKNNIHIIKNDIIKQIRGLKIDDDDDKKKINSIIKTLTPKYTKNKPNTNTVE